MIFQHRLTTLFFLVANLFGYSSQQTSTEGQCDESGDAIKVCSSIPKFLFEQGKSYKYEFSSVTTQLMKYQKDGVSNLLINGEAILTKTGSCEYILSLEKLVISNRDSKGATIPANLVTTAVKFTRRNGVVNEFFISGKDSAWLVNIKRAIVSMLQNKAFSSETASSLEVSVSGNCSTTHFKSGDTYIKQINLNNCAQRETSPMTNLGIPYEDSPGYQSHSLPLLNSSSFCEQVVTSGIIQTVTCSEDHKLFPSHRHFHNSEGTFVKSTLKLTATETKYTAEEITKMNEDIKHASTITFDQGHNKSMSSGDSGVIGRITNILTRLESDINQAEYYIELLDAVKDLENPNEFFSGKDFVFTKKVKLLFIEASAETDTLASMLFIIKLIKESELPFLTKIRFYRRIGFSSEPRVEGLDALESLINTTVVGTTSKDRQRHLDNALLLGASGYAHQYCNLPSVSCADSPNLNRLSETISNFVVDSRIPDKNSGNAVIPALYALGNIQKLSPGAVSKILHYLSEANEDWVKIIAMQAFRNDPCQKELKEKIKSILGLVTASEDLRINAYLALSKCLVAEDLPAIDAIFNDKESAPVGRFIISHVRNIRESVSPSKSKLKSTLSIINLPDKLQSPRKSLLTSIYHEYSHFNEENNLGISAAATVIFGPQTKVPLAITLDVTIDALGRSYNIFEGTLSRRTIKSDLDWSINSMYDQFMLLLEAGHRNDAYLRLFGMTRFVGDFRDAESRIGSLMRQAFDEIKLVGFGIELIRVLPITFLNLEVSYPTISGFPLSLDFQGATLHSLKAENVSGSMGLLELQVEPLSSTADSSIDLKKMDSISLKISMRVGRPDFTPMQIGIAKEYSLNSLVELGIDINKEKLTKLHLQVRLPKSDFATFSFSKNTFFFENIDGAFSKVPYSNSAYPAEIAPEAVCEHFIEKFTGVLFCGFVHYPYNGIDRDAAQYNLTLRKSEEQMKGFVINVDVDYDRRGNSTFSLVLDTPGSSNSRKVTTQYKSDVYDYYQSPEERSYTTWRNFDVMSPWKNVNISVIDKWTAPSKHSSGSYSVDSSLSLGDDGPYQLNYISKTPKLITEDEVQENSLGGLSHSANTYEYDMQLIFPQESVMFSVHDRFYQRYTEGMFPNISNSFTVGGKYVEELGVDGTLLSSWVQQKGSDLAAIEELINFDVSVKNKSLGNYKLQLNYKDAFFTSPNSDVSSTLQIGDKIYTYNSAFRSDLEYDEEKKKNVDSYTYNSSYSESPGDRSANLNSKLTVETSENVWTLIDTYATVSSTWHKTFTLKGEYRRDGMYHTGFVNLDEQDENVGRIQGEVTEGDILKANVTAFIKSLVDFKSNMEVSKTEMSSQMQVQLIQCGTWANHTCKASVQGEVITQHSETLWGHKEKTLGTVTTDTNVNTAARTLLAKSVFTLDEKTDTVVTNASWAENMLNGHSDVIITLATSSGENLRKVLELDTKEDLEAELSSATVHLLVEETAKGAIDPVEVTFKTTMSWKNRQPEEMLYTHSLINNLNYSRACPRPEVGDGNCHDLIMTTEIDTSNTKARDLFTLGGALKCDGNIMKADTKGSFEFVGSTEEIWNRGLIRINGTNVMGDGSEEYNLASSFQYDHKLPESIQKLSDIEYNGQYYRTFLISRKDLKSGESTVIFDLVANSSRIMNGIMDFEVLESVRYNVSGNAIRFVEVIRVRDNEFLFLYDLTEGENTLVLIEVAVKLREENEQLKLDVHSKNNFEHKPSNFNFTLTR